MSGEFSVINIIVNNATDTAQCTNTIEVNILFYVLGGSSAVVSLLVLWQLINLCSVSRETGLKYEGKRLFHWVLFGSLLGRSFFCFVSPSICRLPLFPYIFLYIWINHSLEMVFFFAFFLLSTFWTDIITSLRGPGGLCSTGCLRGGLLVVTLFVVAVVLVFLGLFLGRTDMVLLWDAIFAGVVNLLSILVALLFLVLGIILFRLLRKTDQLITVNVEKKKSMAKTVFFVTALCTVCFAFRVIVSIYSIAQEWDGTGTNGFDVPAEVFFLYFFLPEIVGSSMMLFLLRVPKVARRAASVQEYHRIV